MHQTTSEWHLTLNSQKYPAYIQIPTSEVQSFVQFTLRPELFSRYKVVENEKKNRKCTEWPQNYLKHSTVKSTLYTLGIYHQYPNFGPFPSTAVFQIQDCQKSEMHRMTSDWLWTLNGKKYPVCNKYLPLRPKFWSALLYGQPFQDIVSFIFSHWLPC